MIMNAIAVSTPQFRRKTTLTNSEYRRNFRQIDNDVITVVTSSEADAVTPLMSKIYLRLVNAPENYWERQGVLRFEAEAGEGKRRTAWQALCGLLNVSSSTANKALTWLSRVGVIGYFSGKNGVGIRIFLNRASASIGIKLQSPPEKILPFPPALFEDARASIDEAAFNGSWIKEDLELDYSSRTPDGGADREQTVNQLPNSKRLASREVHYDAAPVKIPTQRIDIGVAELAREILAEI